MGKIQDEVLKIFAESYDISIEDMKEIALIDWAAREGAELFVSGERKSTETTPFITDDDGALMKGEDLERELYHEYCREFLTRMRDELNEKQYEMDHKETEALFDKVHDYYAKKDQGAE